MMISQRLQQEVASIDDLVSFYHHVNWEQSLYVGIEWERSGIYRTSHQPVPYHGDSGYNAVLHKLVEEVGWEVISYSGDDIYEVQRGNARVAIEGDGRLELAGSPQADLHDLARELRLHNNEVIEMGNIFGIGWLSTGQQPIHTNPEISILEKDRYQILQKVGNTNMMETMTKRLNGITANLSYLNEENAIQKAKTAFRVLPIVGAIFASSPFDGGRRSGYLDARRHIIQNHAPQRTGIPQTILDPSFSIADWFTYYVDLPVLFINDKPPESPLTFRDWMEKGYNGSRPTVQNFDQHVKTTWSDIRLRPSYLEYRVADSTPFEYIMALPALMKGLLFDSDSWDQVAKLTESWTYEDILRIDKEAWTHGLQTDVNGKKLLTYAQEIITIANEKLHCFERTDAQEDDESVYLAPLKEQIFIKEQSFAEELTSLYDTEWNQDIGRVLKWCEQDF